MDGQLPQIPIPVNYQPQPPPGMPGMPQQQQQPQPRSMGLPGRPLGDPEAQEAKVLKAQEQRRIEELLPKQATDSRIMVYRLRNGRRLAGAKPALKQVLISEVEEESRKGVGCEEYLRSLLEQRYADRGGTFQCQVVDKHGKLVTGFAPFTISLDDDQELDDEEEEVDDGGPPPGYEEFDPTPPAPPAYVAPPPPPALDTSAIAATLRNERRDEQERSSSMMSIITTMMQSGQQQSSTMVQALAQIQAANQQQMIMLQQQAAQAERDREAKLAASNSEMWMKIMALIPIVLPVVQNLFQKKDGIDPTTAILIEVLKNKDNTDGMKTMVEMMSAGAKQQIEMMGQAAGSAQQMQGQLMKTAFDTMLQSVKDVKERESAPKEDSTIGQILQIAGPILQNMAAGRNPPQSPALPAPEEPRAVPGTDPAGPVPLPRPRRPAKIPAPVQTGETQAPPPPPPPAPRPPTKDPSHYPDDERIRRCLVTVAKMSTGDIVPKQRWQMLSSISKWMPATMLDAAKAGDREKVVSLGQAAVLSDPALLQWFLDSENVDFLGEVLGDIKALVAGMVTPEWQAKSISDQAGFVAKRARKAAEAPPAAAPPPAPPAAVQPPPAPPAPPAQG